MKSGGSDRLLTAATAFFQRPLGVGVGRPFEAPMDVRKLDEIEVVDRLAGDFARRVRPAPSPDANTTRPTPANFRNSRLSIAFVMIRSLYDPRRVCTVQDCVRRSVPARIGRAFRD